MKKWQWRTKVLALSVIYHTHALHLRCKYSHITCPNDTKCGRHEQIFEVIYLWKKRKSLQFQYHKTSGQKLGVIFSFFAKLTLVMLNKLRFFQFSANQITWSRLLIQIHILSGKQCRSRSVGFFFRHQLMWIYTVCKGRAYLGSAGQGLRHILCIETVQQD